jgi:hypothetical protein
LTNVKSSLHLEFNAIDFTVQDKEYLRNLFLQLDIWDKEYHFKFLPKSGSMGIGFYENRFIHLDTRATLKRIAPARWRSLEMISAQCSMLNVQFSIKII